MSLPAKVTALLTSLTGHQVSSLPPAVRQQLADQCRRVLRLVEEPQPKSGVLARLKDGERAP